MCIQTTKLKETQFTEGGQKKYSALSQYIKWASRTRPKHVERLRKARKRKEKRRRE